MPITVSVVAPADPMTVWGLLTDVAGWPAWNPTCVAAQIDTAAPEVGSRLRLQLVHPRGRRFWTAPTIAELVPGQRLTLLTRSLGFRAPTEFVVAPHVDGTAVTLTSRSHGPLAFSYRLTFPEKTQGLLWSGALTGLARHLRTAS